MTKKNGQIQKDILQKRCELHSEYFAFCFSTIESMYQKPILPKYHHIIADYISLCLVVEEEYEDSFFHHMEERQDLFTEEEIHYVDELLKELPITLAKVVKDGSFSYVSLLDQLKAEGIIDDNKTIDEDGEVESLDPFVNEEYDEINEEGEFRVKTNREAEELFQEREEKQNQLNPKEALRLLQDILDKYPTFWKGYDALANMYGQQHKFLQLYYTYKNAFETLVQYIADKDGNRPASIPRGHHPNREVVQVAINYASFLWESGIDTPQALQIYRNILQTNYDDNPGIRFYILAIREGIESPSELDKLFAVENSFFAGGRDAIKSNEWFEKYSIKYPLEFAEYEAHNLSPKELKKLQQQRAKRDDICNQDYQGKSDYHILKNLVEFERNPQNYETEWEGEKVETYVRETPKVGRNDPCPCGSGKK